MMKASGFIDYVGRQKSTEIGHFVEVNHLNLSPIA